MARCGSTTALSARPGMPPVVSQITRRGASHGSGIGVWPLIRTVSLGKS
jgi:hypothetical protein